MRRFFDHRGLTYLFSLGLAIALWFHVHGEFQIRRTIHVKVAYLRTEQVTPFGPRPDLLTVEIRGPAALVQRLSEQKQRVNVDLYRFRPGPAVVGNFDAVLRKEFPRAVEILSIQPREIEFEVDSLGASLVSLKVDVEGTPADGFQITGIEFKPERVKVAGAQKALKDFQALAVGPVDASQARGDIPFNIEVNSEMPDLWVVGATQVRGVVRIEEQIIKKDVDIPVQILNSNFRHSIAPEAIRLTVEGRYGALQALSSKDFLAFVDAGALRPGIYRKPIAIKPPASVKIVDNAPRYFSIRLWKE